MLATSTGSRKRTIDSMLGKVDESKENFNAQINREREREEYMEFLREKREDDREERRRVEAREDRIRREEAHERQLALVATRAEYNRYI
jgi:hypothetical protein